MSFSANKAKYLNNEKIIIQRSLKCLLNRCNNYRNEIAFANLNSIPKYRESLKSSFELFQNPCTSFATLSVLRRKLLLPINFINISAENIASFHFTLAHSVARFCHFNFNLLTFRALAFFN